MSQGTKNTKSGGMKKLLLTLAYQRQAELQEAVSQLGQMTQMTQDPNEQQFLQQKHGQTQYMLQELTEAIKVAER